MNENVLVNAALWIVPLMLAIVFHEVAHGWVARYFGDATAHRLGRLSLNPIKHVDPFGTVLLPMILAISGAPIFGWAKPVPVVQSRLRNPRWNMVAVAAAGPATNVVLALISAAALILFIKASGHDVAADGIPYQLLTRFMLVNVSLAIFNMLPIPPFDGSKVLGGILPPSLGDAFAALDKYALLILMGLLVLLPMAGMDPVGAVMRPAMGWAIETLTRLVSAFI